MKKKIITIFVILFVICSLGYLIIGNPIVAVHNRQLKHAITSIDGKETITLNEIIPFDWDIVYTFDPYTSKKEIAEAIGFKSNSIKETVSEGMVQLIFVRKQHITASICGHASVLGYEVYLNKSVSFENHTAFSVEYTKDHVVLKQQ